jgi:predicted DNA-binding ribbon-helix-helix protein
MQLQEVIKTLAKTKKMTVAKLVAVLREAGDPWREARGILKHKKLSGPAYQKSLRREWQR